MDVTSSTAQASSAETTETIIVNLLAFSVLTLNIKVIIQAKKPASLSMAINTIIPIRKSITSKEEESIKFSMSIVLEIKRMLVPRKAKARRNSQKNTVPNIERENIDKERAWREFRPKSIPHKPIINIIDAIRNNFIAILLRCIFYILVALE